MVGHGGSSARLHLADPTSLIPSHCASIVVTSTVRINSKHCVTSTARWYLHIWRSLCMECGTHTSPRGRSLWWEPRWPHGWAGGCYLGDDRVHVPPRSSHWTTHNKLNSDMNLPASRQRQTTTSIVFPHPNCHLTDRCLKRIKVNCSGK